MVQHGQRPADPSGPPEDLPVQRDDGTVRHLEVRLAPLFPPAEPATGVLAWLESVARR